MYIYIYRIWKYIYILYYIVCVQKNKKMSMPNKIFSMVIDDKPLDPGVQHLIFKQIYSRQWV